MESTFEAEKNRKAFLYTAIICGVLLLLAIFITWPIMKVSEPVVQDLIQVNLGNDNEGFGDVQPLIKGAMAPYREAIVQPQRAVAKEQSDDQPQPDDDAGKDAATVTKTEKKTTRRSEEIKPVVQKTKTDDEQKVITPKQQKPKFTYNGPSNGNGNNADVDNGYRYQGNKPGGKGDAGTSSGNPDSYGNSPGGKIGISRGLAGRHITHFPTFQDDFNEDAKVYVDVSVDGSGNVLSSSIAKGTSTTNQNIQNIALQKAKQLKFNPGEEDNGTIIFDFKVQN